MGALPPASRPDAGRRGERAPEGTLIPPGPDLREPAGRAGVITGRAPGTVVPSRPDGGPDPDAELVQAASHGDARAFEEIVRRHAGLVLGVGRRLLGNRSDAEDLLQDVFVRVHRGLERFRGASSTKTWIARIAVNAAHNRRRDDSRRGLHAMDSLDAPVHEDGEPLAASIADDRPDPERLALSGEARERVDRALGELPIEFREALVLREIEQMSYDEIAVALEVSVGTVKSRISRGRARLQEALGDLVAPAPGHAP